MTRVSPQGTHPRKPTWARFLCRRCDEFFWGPDDNWPDDTPRWCEWCADGHYIQPRQRHPASIVIRDYHGHVYHSGEAI